MRRVPTPAGVVVLALAYYGCAKLGLAQGFLEGNVTPVWPPTGLSLVALVMVGPRLWPGVFLGALAVNGLSPVPWGAALAMATGNTAEALIGAGLLRRAGFRPDLGRLRDVALLTCLAAGLSTLVSATIGVASLGVAGVIPWGEALASWRVWWLGDAMGGLVVAPVLFTTLAGGHRRLAPGLEAAALVVAVGASAVVGFGGASFGPFMVFPVLVWAALRFTQRGAAAVTSGVAVLAIVQAANGTGPFADPDTVQSLWRLDGFLTVLALTGLALAAVVTERDGIARDLRSTRDALEGRVRDQTAEVRAERERLDQAQRIANVGSWEWRPATGEVAWSPEMLRIHGLTGAEPPATFRAYLDRLPPGDREALEGAIQEALTGSAFGPLEYRVVGPDGGVRWISAQGECLLRRRDGGSVTVQGICQDVTLRRAADEALRESEERFRFSFENAPIGMALVAPDGRWLRVNRSLCEIVGYPPEVLLTKTFQSITHPDDLDADLEPYRQTLAGEISGYSREKRYLHADGHVVWINLSVTLVRDETGRPRHFIGLVEDISSRKANDLALRHSHDLLDRSEALGRTGSWEWDTRSGPSGRVTWSQGMYRIHGVAPGAFEITEESTAALIHPDDREEFRRRFDEAARSGTGVDGFTYRAVWPDGSVRWIWAQGRVATDRPFMLIGFAHDVTERREADERFRALLESAPDGMVIVDDGGRIVLVNRQAELLFGYSREHLVGQAVELLLPERVRAAHRGFRTEFAAHPVSRPMGGEMELLARRADGTEFPVEVSLSPLRTEQGTIVSAAIRDITARKQAEANLAHHALHDALTGLPNRVLLADRLDLALARAARAGTGVAVLFADLDRFKLINDTQGHATGDQVLIALAERLRAVVRPGDTVARFGGDEFVVICENTMATWEATMLGERISDALRRPFDVAGKEVFLSVSVGIAVAEPGSAGSPGEHTSDSLLRDADGAMYRAKERGRGGVEFFDESMRTEAAERLDTLTALHRAMGRNELRVLYQPVVDLASGAVVGAEALLRWLHPDRGLVGPSEFIPIAEETGLIIPIGTWVLEEAARQLEQWRLAFPDRAPLAMAVNLSARQLRQPDLVGTVRATLRRHGVDPTAVCFELTESVLMDDIEHHPGTLHALRALGIGLAIDDFGTGYSSLTYLKRFPVNVIKIDQHFVAGLGQDAFDTAIVESTIDLAHSLGLRVAAEGVETAEQFDRLRTLGCDLAQGHYIARPLEADAFEAALHLQPRAALGQR